MHCPPTRTSAPAVVPALSLAVALAFSLGASPAAQAQRPEGTLEPVVDCVSRGDWQVLERSRLPEHVRARRVDTLQGPARVSLADGWRLLLAPPGGTAPSLNVKIERSMPAHFDADRAALRAQMAYFVSRAPAALPLHDETTGNVSLLMLRRPDLVSRGAMGVATLTNAATQLVVSATFLDAATLDASLSQLLGCAALPLAE